MAWTVLDIERDKPAFSQRVTLDGADYTLTFVWNMRSGWYMGVTSGDTVLFEPRRLGVERDLLDCVRWHEACPPGYLIAHDTTGAGLPPGYEDLRGGTRQLGRVILAYGAPDGE